VRSIDRLFLKLERRDKLSEDERAALERVVARTETYRPDKDIVVEGVPQTESRLLLSGITCRYKGLSNGKRQITALHIAGDFIDLHSFTLKKLDHNVAAMTPVTLAVVPHDALREITETMPHLTRVLWLNTMLDAAIHREWVVALGRKSATAHVANLLCEMYLRNQIVGLASEGSYDLPLTQGDMADVCGLTDVHVNRVMQELRATGAVEWKSGRVTVHDWDALQRIAEFDPAFVHLEHLPR